MGGKDHSAFQKKGSDIGVIDGVELGFDCAESIHQRVAKIGISHLSIQISKVGFVFECNVGNQVYCAFHFRLTDLCLRHDFVSIVN